jgi:hypothetical protein
MASTTNIQSKCYNSMNYHSVSVDVSPSNGLPSTQLVSCGASFVLRVTAFDAAPCVAFRFTGFAHA